MSTLAPVMEAPNFRFVKLDICDREGVYKLFEEEHPDMVETEKYGHYHAANEGGFISWYDFACEIFRQAGKITRVIPVTTRKRQRFSRQALCAQNTTGTMW